MTRHYPLIIGNRVFILPICSCGRVIPSGWPQSPDTNNENSPAMKKRDRTVELEPFQPRKVNLAKFKSDISRSQRRTLFGAVGLGGRLPGFLLPIETLSVTNTVGRGRTNLTFIRPTIVHVDATTPFAGFDRRESPARAPAIQMHFEPQAYGITTASNYVMEFAIETFGSATFRIDGSFGFITNTGLVTVNGRRIVTLVFQNVPPAEQTFGFIEQTAGERWNWFSVSARFPIPVIVADA